MPSKRRKNGEKQIIKKASERKLLKLAEFRMGLAHWQWIYVLLIYLFKIVLSQCKDHSIIYFKEPWRCYKMCLYFVVVSGLMIKRSCTTQNNSVDNDIVMKSIDWNCMLARESFKRRKFTIKLTECVLMLSCTLIFPFNDSLARWWWCFIIMLLDGQD